MSKYYKIPKKMLNPRAVHLYDIPLVALVIAVALTLMPIGTTLDFSAGFNEKSSEYQAEEFSELMEKFGNDTFSRSDLEDLFDGTTVQNGGYAYRATGESCYLYQDGRKGLEYYTCDYDGETGSAATSADEDLPRGMMDRSGFVSVGEDGRIYYDDLDGVSGWTDSYIDLDAEVDYVTVAAMMDQSNQEAMSMEDAALVWSLIDRDILVGYSDGAAMFHEVRDGVNYFIRATSEGTEEVSAVEGILSNVLAAADNYLFYVLDGSVYIHCIETGERTYLPMDEWTDLGTVRELAYVVYSDGSIRLYSLNSVKCIAVDLTGNGVENSGMHRYDDVDCSDFVGIQAFRMYENKIALYFRQSDGTYKGYTQNN